MEQNWKKVKGRVTTRLVERAGVPFLSFPLLEETGIVTQGFSTRLGGVSEGDCSSMNVSFTRGDREEAVREYAGLAQGRGTASACIGCGRCERHCPQHIGIIRALQQVAQALENV